MWKRTAELRKPLNEGRGCNPGDTGYAETVTAPAGDRSMRAGAVTPATHENMEADNAVNAAQ